MSTPVRADAKFLRRVLLAMVMMTVLTGSLAAFTTVQAMDGMAGNCLFFCN